MPTHLSRSALRPLLTVLALLAPAAASAQTGPFADGELLVRARDPISLDYDIARIDPATGASAIFIEDIKPSSGSFADWIEYDPYRDGVLMYSSYGPLQIPDELLLVRAGGDVHRLGFAGDQLTGFAPTGDGRVYMIKDKELHVLDTANTLTKVLDSSGQPVDFLIHHLVYDAPSNALISGTQSGIASALCGSGVVQVARLPLTPDGLQLSAPATCNGYAVQFGAAVIGLDHLPTGNILITQADGWAQDPDQLHQVDPVNLAIGVWASSSISDLDGGAWSPGLGAAVVLDDTSNVLRAYTQGQSGGGTVIPVGVPLGDSTTGWSKGNNLADVDVTGPKCPGQFFAFGQGLPGTSSLTPRLSVASCPRTGAPLPLTLAGGLGNATGIIGVGLGATTYPLFGGTGYVDLPLLTSATVTLSGPGAGKGFGQIVFPIPSNPAVVGVQLFAQGAVVDPAAVQGIALTNAVSITIG